MTSANDILEELAYNANASGNKPLERRTADLAIWFWQNHQRIPRDNLAARQAFFEKALWTFMEVNALLVERLHEVEAMKRGKSRLYLPRGLRANGHDFT